MNEHPISRETNELLRQILKWTRFQSLDSARRVLQSEVAKDPNRLLVYELTNGERGRPEVSRLSRVPSSTIQMWWDRWFKLGVLELSPKRKGMVRKICGVEEVGIDIPKEVKSMLQGELSSERTGDHLGLDSTGNADQSSQGGHNG